MAANINAHGGELGLLTSVEAALAAQGAVELPLGAMLARRSPDQVIVNPTIMIVDDEPINIKVSKKFLSLEGYREFLTTTDPRTAFGLAVERQPDLVLLDIMMPDVSGLEVLRQLRSDERTADLPIIILTASNDNETRFQALSFGATDFLYKPLDPLDLMPRVRNALIAKSQHDKLRNYAWEMELEVQARTTELRAAQRDLVTCLDRLAGQFDRLLATTAAPLEPAVAAVLAQARHDVEQMRGVYANS